MEVNDARNSIIGVSMIIAFVTLIIFATICFVSCTYSITMAHTEGSATDLIDETQDAQADIKPNLNIPAAAL